MSQLFRDRLPVATSPEHDAIGQRSSRILRPSGLKLPAVPSTCRTTWCVDRSKTVVCCVADPADGHEVPGGAAEGHDRHIARADREREGFAGLDRMLRVGEVPPGQAPVSLTV